MTAPSLPPTPPPDGAPAVGPYEPPVIQPVKPARPKRSNAGGFLLTAAAVIAVGGIAFAAGRVTAPATTNAAVGANGFGNGGFGNGGFGNGGAGGTGNGGPGGSFTPGEGFRNGVGGLRGAVATEATVTAVAPDQLTIQIGNSTQTIDVKTDANTTYHTQQTATSSAVKAGSKVLIQFAPETTAAGASPAPTASPAPGTSGAPGGFFGRGLGTVKDVTILAP